MRKLWVFLTIASIAIGTTTVPAHAAPKLQKVFNSLPAQLPGNVSSVGFEATQTDALGDQIRLSPGSGRKLRKVSVVMSSWACETGTWTANCDTTPGATFTESIKLTLYKANKADPNLPGAVLGSRKRTFTIPYRPSADPTNCSANPTQWYSPEDKACFNGMAVAIVFEFDGLKLPNQLVYAISYNTSTSGNTPEGTRPCQATTEGCPDDSLNVGTGAGLPAIGSDVYPDGVFTDQAAGGDCTTDATVSDNLSLDACTWAGFNPLVRFEVKKK